jgi:acyl-homoserine lactone acylase PvdQ
MSRIAAALVVAFALSASPALAKDYAATARNIIPSGQLGSFPVPAGADQQAQMYDALTPLGNQVTDADLQTDFKSEGFGVGPDGPGRVEATPRKGVTIVRDRFNVPHITGNTHDDVTWAMGWVVGEDRALLIAEARNPARLAAIDAPNIDAFALVKNLRTYTPTKAVDRMVLHNGVAALKSAGPDGKALLHDVDVYVEGLNARLRKDKSTQPPWTRVDVFAANALAGQIFGQGGGDEARRSEYLNQLQTKLGAVKGQQVFDDLSESTDSDSPATMSKAFPYGVRATKSTAGNAILDAGSFKPAGPAGLARAASAHPNWASNFEIVSRQRSTTGHPLFVGGPQIGYYYPGLTLEADVKGPGFEARGATAPGFPGTILIGRGEDFAWSLTSAGSDLIDEFAETLCGGSRTRYLYNGTCRKMGRVDAGTIKGSGRVVYSTTVHGPVVGYATVAGKTVAISRKRASFGQDILWQLPFRDMTTGRVKSPATFFKAVGRTPFTFNIGYADDRDIAMYSGGKLPIRDPRVDPRLPTKGTGQYEWKGFLPASKHPQQVDPPSGLLVNWNNRPAPQWAAADDNWADGSTQRVQLLLAGLATRQTHDLASVVSAMNGAATQDLRSVVLTPTLAAVLANAPAPSARAQRMLALLQAWVATGSSRLDRDLDGVMDAGPAPAIMDALYPRLFAAAMGGALSSDLLAGLTPLIGSDSGPSSGFTDGGFWYLDKDLRTLAGTTFAAPFGVRYCGAGVVAACAAGLWAAFDQAGADLQTAQGTADPDAWRDSATKERITFAPGLLKTTIRYTNRPSGIQQVISFSGHRPGGRWGPRPPPGGRRGPGAIRRPSAGPCRRRGSSRRASRGRPGARRRRCARSGPGTRSGT